MFSNRKRFKSRSRHTIKSSNPTLPFPPIRSASHLIECVPKLGSSAQYGALAGRMPPLSPAAAICPSPFRAALYTSQARHIFCAPLDSGPDRSMPSDHLPSLSLHMFPPVRPHGSLFEIVAVGYGESLQVAVLAPRDAVSRLDSIGPAKAAGSAQLGSTNPSGLRFSNPQHPHFPINSNNSVSSVSIAVFNVGRSSGANRAECSEGSCAPECWASTNF